MGELDFDTAVNQSWASFRDDLAGRITRIRPGTSLVITRQAHCGGARVRLTAAAPDAATRVCQVDLVDLDVDPAHRAAQLAGLRVLGWLPLDERSLRVEAQHNASAQLAHIMVRALREIWYVLHPTFLDDDRFLTTTEDRRPR